VAKKAKKASEGRKAAAASEPADGSEEAGSLSLGEKERRQLLDIVQGDGLELGALCKRWDTLRAFARRYELGAGDRAPIEVRAHISPWHFYESTKSTNRKGSSHPKPTAMLWAEHLRDATGKLMPAMRDRGSQLQAQRLLDALADAIAGRASDIRTPLDDLRPVVGMLARQQNSDAPVERLVPGGFGSREETRRAVDRWRAAIAWMAGGVHDGRAAWTVQQHRQELSEACIELANALEHEGIDSTPARMMTLKTNLGLDVASLEPYLHAMVACVDRLRARSIPARREQVLDLVHDPSCKSIRDILRAGPRLLGAIEKDQRLVGSRRRTSDLLRAMADAGMVTQTKKRGPWRFVSDTPRK
jgi:hypothetical protein